MNLFENKMIVVKVINDSNSKKNYLKRLQASSILSYNEAPKKYGEGKTVLCTTELYEKYRAAITAYFVVDVPVEKFDEFFKVDETFLNSKPS